MNDSRSDEALMTAYAEDGDQAAFAELFARYQPLLTSVVRRRVQDPEDARDLVQQAFLQAHRARDRYHPGRPLRPWLHTIAANLSRDFVRLRRHTCEIQVDHDAPAPPTRDPIVVLRERHLVRRAVSELPHKQRDVMAMHWFEGMTYREIAARIGATPTAVKLHGYRGKKALEERLSGSQPERRAAA